MASIANLTPQKMFKAQTHIYNHLLLYIKSMSLKCCLELGIPDIIHNHRKPITLPDLASSLGIHPTKTPCLSRLMQMLVHSGFFSVENCQESDGDHQLELAYDLTLSSRLLVRDNPNCLSLMLSALFAPQMVLAFDFLVDWLREDEQIITPFEHAHELNFWDFFTDDKNWEFKRLFNEEMASESRMMNLVIGESKPIFEGLPSLVDVGGGIGSLARVISEAFPDVKCTVLDLPPVVANLEGTNNCCLSDVVYLIRIL